MKKTLTLALAFCCLTPGTQASERSLLRPVTLDSGFPVPAVVTESAARFSAVHVDLGALARALEPGSSLELHLAPGLFVEAIAERLWITDDDADAFTWKGSIAGDPLSAAVLTFREGRLAAGISIGERRFQITPGAGGRHWVHEVDLARLPVGGDDSVTPPASARGRAGLVRQKIESKAKTIFDLLVVYTKAARKAAGGEAAIRSLIDLGVAETKVALDDSNTRVKLRLRDAREIGYKGSGNLSTDLGRLQSTTDGKLDKVHGWRNEARADFVKLVVNKRDPNRCGTAYLAPNASNAAAFAFSVTRDSCISPNYTFGHELGHNMGLQHARTDNANNPPFFPYGFGYHEPDGRFRTVMALSCSGCGRRVLHFSNPKVRESGRRTGVSRKKPDGADNARAIRNARQFLAAFR